MSGHAIGGHAVSGHAVGRHAVGGEAISGHAIGGAIAMEVVTRVAATFYNRNTKLSSVTSCRISSSQLEQNIRYDLTFNMI